MDFFEFRSTFDTSLDCDEVARRIADRTCLTNEPGNYHIRREALDTGKLLIGKSSWEPGAAAAALKELTAACDMRLQVLPPTVWWNRYEPNVVFTATLTPSNRGCHVDYTVELKHWKLWLATVLVAVPLLGGLWALNFRRLGFAADGLSPTVVAILPFACMAVVATVSLLSIGIRLRYYRDVVRELLRPIITPAVSSGAEDRIE